QALDLRVDVDLDRTVLLEPLHFADDRREQPLDVDLLPTRLGVVLEVEIEEGLLDQGEEVVAATLDLGDVLAIVSRPARALLEEPASEPDDAVDRRARRLAKEIEELALRPARVGLGLRTDVHSHALEKLERVERFRDVVARARSIATQTVLETGACAHEDDRDDARLRAALERATDLVAVEPRHHHVEEDEVRPEAPNDVETFLPRPDGRHLELLAEDVLHDLVVDRVVVHPEDSASIHNVG